MTKQILVACIGTELGGVEKSMIEFLRFLKTQDCEVDLIHWKKPGPLFEQIPNDVSILPRVSPMGVSDIKRQRSPLKICKELVWYLTLLFFKSIGKPWNCFKKLNKHYDIAISYCQNGYSPYYIIDKVSADKKYLWYHHGSYEHEGKVKQQDEVYYQKYDKIVTVSHANVAMLENTFPSFIGKICCIHNLFNEENIRAKAKEVIPEIWGEGIKLCTVGRISPEKGQFFALDVAKYLRERGLKFTWVFVGDGSDYEKCLEKAKANNLNECIFVGGKSNPYPYMEQADFYVQPSFVESECITVRETKVLGKKVIASNISALCEALDNGKYGNLYPLDVVLFGNGILETVAEEKDDKEISLYTNGISDNDDIRCEIKKMLFEEK